MVLLRRKLQRDAYYLKRKGFNSKKEVNERRFYLIQEKKFMFEIIPRILDNITLNKDFSYFQEVRRREANTLNKQSRKTSKLLDSWGVPSVV